ncbi:MAG: SDR family oxidoreductase [Deltaproteobacteria bacterium]|nr:SDR family oxidoreductase [Candidatus Zymogenaceae bacterium]
MIKKILVTGASRGIGKAIALMLADKGHSVVGTSRFINKLPAPLKNHPFLQFVEMDVNDPSSVKKGVEAAVGILGGIDVLVNNAGISHIGPFEEMPEDQGRAIMETDFFGAAAVIRAVLPHMRAARSGLIVNVTSLAGQIGVPYQTYYCASKFALEGLSEALRLELYSQNIRVAIVEPGDIKTDIGDHRLLCDAAIPEYRPGFTAACEAIDHSMGRAGPPEDVARVVLDVVNARNPRVRYIAGKGAASTALLMRLLPKRLVERLVRRHYGS